MMQTRYRDLSPEERADVDRIVHELQTFGVGTIDLPPMRGGTGQRHRLRAAIEERTGFKVDYGIDADEDGDRFGWFERRHEHRFRPGALLCATCGAPKREEATT